MHAELTLGHGLVVGRHRVALLMRRAGIQGLSGRPRWRRAPNLPTATDLVDRQFERDGSDQLWVTDITEHPTREGKVYCAVVLDVFSRRVVGWSIDSTPTAALVTNALGMAIDGRRPADGATVIHSDQGTQFTSWAFTRRAIDSGLVPSMGSIGDCYDNAVIESFWSRMVLAVLALDPKGVAVLAVLSYQDPTHVERPHGTGYRFQLHGFFALVNVPEDLHSSGAVEPPACELHPL